MSEIDQYSLSFVCGPAAHCGESVLFGVNNHPLESCVTAVKARAFFRPLVV